MSSLEVRSTPRRYLLRKSPNPNRPLYVIFGGYTHRVDPPGTRGWSFWQINRNIVDESKFLETAEEFDLNVVFIAAARYKWMPFLAQHWNHNDDYDVRTILKALKNEIRGISYTAFLGFSDGGTYVLEIELADPGVIVAHSASYPNSYLDEIPCPVLLICGKEDRTPGTLKAQKQIEDELNESGISCVSLIYSNKAHEWITEANRTIVGFCDRVLNEKPRNIK